MTDLPKSWTEMRERLGRALGNEDADEWLRQALEVTWGAQDMTELLRRQRSLAIQRASGVLLFIEDTYGYELRDYENAEYPWEWKTNVREIVSSVFARYWQGHVLEGPPWQLGPEEHHLPSRSRWLASASFEGPADGPSMVPRRAEAPDRKPQRAEERSTSITDLDSLGVEID